MKWGKQERYCPNCGTYLYDDKGFTLTIPQLCSSECRKEWELKMARSILGKDGLTDSDNSTLKEKEK